MTNNLKNLVSRSLLILGVLFMAVSCSNSNSPEAVAEQFLNHMADANFAEAKKLCDTETASIIGMLESMGGDVDAAGSDEKIEIVSSEIDGDTAVVKYTSSLEEGEKSLDLKKIEGEWKVSFDKENQAKEEGMEGMDDSMNHFDEAMDELDETMNELDEAIDSVQTEVEEVVEEVTAE